MTGATVFTTVNVLWTLLELLQLSFAVKVTSITPQKDVMMAGEGALSERVMTPQPASVAENAALCALSHVVYCAMAVEHGAIPFCRLLAITGGVTSGVTVMVCINVARLPKSSSATQVRVMVPPVQSGALLV